MAEKKKKAPPKAPSGSTTTATTAPKRTTTAYNPNAVAGRYGTLSMEQVEDLRRAILAGAPIADADFRSMDVMQRRRIAQLPDEDMGPTRISVNEALTELRRMDPQTLSRLQESLFGAGFYGDEYYAKTPGVANQVRPGVLDEATMAAYRRLLEAGVLADNKTLTEIINERTTSFAASGGAGARVVGGKVGGANAYLVRLSDPAELRRLADEIGREVVGRKATDETKQRIIGLIQGRQSSNQSTANAASEAAERARFDAAVGAETQGAALEGQGIVNPVPGAAVTNSIGAPRDGGAREHKGTDLFGPKGSAAVAPISGEVVKTGSGGKGGNTVWIKGDDGRFHYLAHFDAVSVKQGQRVNQGQQIGTVGNTGNAHSTNPHIHYSINSKVGSEDAVGNPATELGGVGRTVVQPSTYLSPTTTTVTEVDPQAAIEEEIRSTAPAEAGAHDIAADVYENFLKIIKGAA